MTLMTLLLILAPALPLAFALPPLRRALPWPLLLALLPAAVLVLVPTQAWVSLSWFKTGVALGLDPTARWWLAMSVLLWASAYLLLPITLRTYRGTWLLLALSGQIGAVLSTDLMGFYAFSTLMSYAFIGLLLTDYDPGNRRVGQLYLLPLIVADLLLFDAMLLASATNETLSFTRLAQAVAQPDSPGLYPVLVALGYLLKMGLWPLLLWIPQAHRSPSPALSLMFWVGPIATGLLGQLRWLPLGNLDAPLAGSLLLVTGSTVALYALRQGLAERHWRKLSTLVVCLTAAAVVILMGVCLLQPTLWPRIGLWPPRLVAIGTVTLTLVGATGLGKKDVVSPKDSATPFGDSVALHRVKRVTTHSLPRLRAAWLGYWQAAWHRLQWPQQLEDGERRLRQWRLAITLLLLLAVIMVALPVSADSGVLPRHIAGGPGPLEIEAPQPAGDVHHFADEVEAGHPLALHGLGAELIGVHPAQGHLGGAVALVSAGLKLPAVELLGDIGQGGLIQLPQGLIGPTVVGDQRLRQPPGEML